MQPTRTLPLGGASAQAYNHPRAAAMASSPVLPRVEPMTPLRILIVEDDAMIGWLVGDLMEMMGHKVCAIETSEDGAIAAARQYSPDMMVVDAQLRVGDGVSAVEKILRERFVPHVFVTGDPRGVRELRPDAVLVAKPFTEACLVNAVESAWDAARC